VWERRYKRDFEGLRGRLDLFVYVHPPVVSLMLSSISGYSRKKRGRLGRGIVGNRQKPPVTATRWRRRLETNQQTDAKYPSASRIRPAHG
jgi:hypothetical protein